MLTTIVDTSVIWTTRHLSSCLHWHKGRSSELVCRQWRYQEFRTEFTVNKFLPCPVSVEFISTFTMEAFRGKYERISVENMDEFLQEMGVNFLLRKAATASTPLVEISESDGVWFIKTSTTLRSHIVRFKVSEVTFNFLNETPWR